MRVKNNNFSNSFVCFIFIIIRFISTDDFLFRLQKKHFLSNLHIFKSYTTTTKNEKKIDSWYLLPIVHV